MKYPAWTLAPGNPDRLTGAAWAPRGPYESPTLPTGAWAPPVGVGHGRTPASWLGPVASGRTRGVCGRRGGASWRSTARPPARFTSRTEHHSGTKQKNLAPPPHPHVRKKLESPVPRGTRGQPSASWMDSGWVNWLCFWTGPRRWIAALASRLRSEGQRPRALAGSSESV